MDEPLLIIIVIYCLSIIIKIFTKNDENTKLMEKDKLIIKMINEKLERK